MSGRRSPLAARQDPPIDEMLGLDEKAEGASGSDGVCLVACAQGIQRQLVGAAALPC